MADTGAEWPTPLALVGERLRLVPEQSAQERYDAALFLVECAIKFVTCTALSVLRSHGPETAQGFAYELVRAESIGTWVGVLGRSAQKLHRLSVQPARQFANVLTHKEAPERDSADGQLGALVSNLRKVVEALDEPDYIGSDRRRHSLLDIMGDIVFVRNRTRGHGAKTWRFYEVAAEPMATAARLIVQRLPTSFQWAVVTASKTPGDGWLDVLILNGLQPEDRDRLEAQITAERGTAVVLSGNFVVPLEPLADVVPDTLETFFANGAWREDAAACQFIDYRSGKTQHLHRPLYAGRLAQLPPSETAPEPELTFEAACAHNLPAVPEGYVRRPGLESRLHRLLGDKVHRVITLRGPGGSGKTSLALKALHDLVSGGGEFDVVIWFSARDVDLLVGGPAPRRRDLADLDGIVRTFVALAANEELDHKRAAEFFATTVDGNRPGAAHYLLVVDNFETFDSPAAVHQFLDETVVLPSKVLITSRHQTFQGDFPLEVRGMEEEEAQSLVSLEARRHYCEPRLTTDVRRQIIDATGASPYAMKLAVANFAAGESARNIVQSIGRRDDVLSALFDRSFEMLSDDGRFLYLLLGAMDRPALEVALRAALLLVDKDPDEALEELTRYSLGGPGIDAYENQTVDLVQMASLHAKRMLIGHEDELLIQKRARDFRRWSQVRPGHSPVGAFFQNLFDEASDLPGAGHEAWEEIISIAEKAAQSYPDLWAALARALDSAQAKPERVRVAFKRAVEAAPLDAERWVSWAAFERRQGEQLQFLNKSIRAIEIDSSNPRHCSDIAAALADYLSAHKDEIPPERRDMLLGSVRFALEGHRRAGRLDSTDLSRLGWLYLLEYSPSVSPDIEVVRAAQECARDGLKLEAQNIHCKRLLERTSRIP